MFSSFGTVWRGTRLDDLEPVPLETAPLGRVVGHQAHGGDPEIHQDLRADTVLAAVDRQTQLDVGVHRVQTAVLQLVCLELVG